ncbi:hypothetical protein FG386_001753, partial [Cryptosporidium ryanae]|uniref:uncharacterized protein n=1 Tax=Cryptosporidium ryanae TaxID=515981 RepID=UPI00351A56D1
MIKFWSIGYVTLLLYIVAFKIDNRSISYSSITYLRNYGTVELSLLKLKSSTLDKIKKCIGCCCCCFRRCHDSCGNSNDNDDDFDNNIDNIFGQGNPPTDRIPIPVRREGHPRTLLERYNQRLQSKTGSGYRS